METSNEQPHTAGQWAEDMNDDILIRAKDWYKNSMSHSDEWRTEAREDYDFFAGKQWTEQDQNKLKEELRPVITFNRVGPLVDAVAGSEVQNRQEVRYIPRKMGAAEVNDMLTGAAHWFRDLADAEDEDSDAFFDLIISGMGWTDTRLDYEQEAEGLPVIDRVDPLEMGWDPAAKKRNLVDSRYVWRLREMDLADAASMFPDAALEDLHAGWTESKDKKNEPHDATEAFKYENDQTPQVSERSTVRILEVQWWDKEVYYRVRNGATGEEGMLEADDYERVKKRAEAVKVPIDAIKLKRKVYRRAFIGGAVLEEELSPSQTGFTYKCMTGKRDRNKNLWMGIVRSMKDPQRWSNKFFSQILHIINSNAKGGIIAERNAFENPRAAESDWAKPNAVTWARPGALASGRIQPKQPITYPVGLDNLMQFSVSSIRDVSGINLEMLGMADRQQAGVLEYQRKQAAITILAQMFDSLRRYRKNQGRLMLEYIREYLSDGRLVKISKQDGAEEYIPLIRDPETVTYDIIVDDAPQSPNQKEKVFQILAQILPVLQSVGAMPPPDVLDYTPLPPSLTKKWKEQLMQPPAPEAQAAQQLELQETAANVKQKETAAQLNLAKAAEEMQRALAQKGGMLDPANGGVPSGA